MLSQINLFTKYRLNSSISLDLGCDMVPKDEPVDLGGSESWN